MIARRDLLQLGPAAACAWALAGLAEAATPRDGRLAARRWLARHDELARSLEAGRITPLQWHDGANALARDADVEEIAALIRRSDWRPPGDRFGHDPAKRFVRFRDEEGRPAKLAYGVATFTFGPDNVITPHGHRHMVSAHMVLEGRVRIRTFDRLTDEDGAMILRPGLDVVGEPGHAAAMCGARDNIHWFAPRSRQAMTLDVIIDGLDAGQERYLIQPVDVLAARPLEGGRLRARILGFEESSRRYTAEL